MKKILFFLFISLVTFAQNGFEKNFKNKTMRFNFYHVGNSEKEQIVFGELLEEPIWGGRRFNLVDTLFLGQYRFAIIDIDGNEIYSNGFSTLFKEWQTTKEAKRISRVFQGVVIFPYPKKKVELKIYSRDEKNKFVEIYSLNIEPEDYFIKEEQHIKYHTTKIKYSGNSSEKYDIVFIPEGYTQEQMDKFIKDCRTLTEYLFTYAPFKEMQNRINVWGVEAPSADSVCDIPADNIWGKTLLNSNYYTFDSERYLMTTDYHKVCDVASNAPYDQIYILANTGKYGGGAIYNFYSLTVTNDPRFKEIFIHELGHGLAGLADEYGYDDTYEDFFPNGVEPWEKNVTTLADFSSKWRKDIKPDTPIPTPADSVYINEIGVFEGAGYVSKGVYRPTYNSIMRTLGAKSYNKICQDAIKEVLLFNSK